MEQEGFSRRGFFKTAVAVGGATALSACLERESADVPKGDGEAPERQHAWNEYLRTDESGNPLMPYHHALLLLDYTGDEIDEDRSTVEDAFGTLERAYEWSHEGLLFTVGYSPYYFDRLDGPLEVELPEPEPLSSFENPELDTFDAVVHLASDHATVVLEAEQALLGQRREANGLAVERDLTGVFEKAGRRTGFVGEGLPAQHQDVAGVPDTEPVPEDSPKYMGFRSGFEESQATEDAVTLGEEWGAFAGGTTQHVSHLHLDLERWYGQDRGDRVSKMFCPAHAEEGKVEGTGQNLGTSSGVGECPATGETARKEGTVGHAQKARMAREKERPPLLRRDFDSTDPGRFDAEDAERAGVHFVSLQESVEDFVRVREAMNADSIVDDEESDVGPQNENGILQYVTTRKRGNYLVPPRQLRALPPASP